MPVCLNIIAVPPDINSEMTSSDVTVNEGSNATLTCKAFGLPRPEIKWRREDGREFVVWERRGIKRKGSCSKTMIYLFICGLFK